MRGLESRVKALEEAFGPREDLVVVLDWKEGPLSGYRIGDRIGGGHVEIINRLPDESEDELRERAVGRFKQVWPGANVVVLSTLRGA